MSTHHQLSMALGCREAESRSLLHLDRVRRAWGFLRYNSTSRERSTTIAIL
ncbi:hypothetical protein Esi_0081_0004 [Ectocarpus siliculosus]|uniref:Uncharacterized protein n=1 Tax=Ectocarpus siliculosus TaxID=2880 RepID=D8LT59_ECTSI|nr:hypothetical protein Esi_0081_0004 [Ectocarpus siliculosus]|eukprot:CBN77930.1 hypothetical protein Esi_0081_0004 [Ectocarpus siliculosus]